MLKYRVISAAVIIACLIAMFFWAPVWFVLLFMAALALAGMYEFYALLNHAGLPALRGPGMGAGLLLCAGIWATQCPAYAAGRFQGAIGLLALLVLAVMFFQLFASDTGRALEKISATLLGLLYVPLLLAFFGLLMAGWSAEVDGRWLVIYLVAVVKSTDMGAYFIGSAIGKHKLYPRISPGKSWEGCIGGVLVALLVSLVFYFPRSGNLGVVQLTLRHAVMLPILLSVIGILGDLVESMMKRAADVKDSSKAVAGMGGILDIIDSLLPAAPVLYCYAQLFLEPL